MELSLDMEEQQSARFTGHVKRRVGMPGPLLPMSQTDTSNASLRRRAQARPDRPPPTTAMRFGRAIDP